MTNVQEHRNTGGAMNKGFDSIVYTGDGEVKIGEATLGEDGTIRVFNQIQPIDGVFYLMPKKKAAN